MLTHIILLCVGIFLCCAIWQCILSFFMSQLNISYTRRCLVLHYAFICVYTLFAYYMSLYMRDDAMPYIAILHSDLLQDSIYIVICLLVCFMLLHVLSTLDFYTQKVPNILLAILFICVNILYYLVRGVYDFYPCSVLGVVYGMYFMLHVAGSRQYIGEGDVWVITGIASLLESFFAYQIRFVFEALCLASILGILYYYFKLLGLKRMESSLDFKGKVSIKQIPFIPFLFLGFLCVSVFHAA